MRTPTRGEVGSALLLSVPPAVGVAGLAGWVLGAAVSVESVAVGLLAGGALFAFVLAGVVVGDPDREGFDLPDRNG
ncbi:MAG: hypothetical protein ABEH77_00535 [Halobacteriaceae archaeon]